MSGKRDDGVDDGTTRDAATGPDAGPEPSTAPSTGVGPGAETGGGGGAGGPDGGERPSRRPRLAVAAVAAAVLLAGGGGAWWASAANGGSGGTPAPLRLDVPVAGGGGSTTGPYHLTGKLPAGPARAAVYRAPGTVAASDVGRLAGLLGVSGSVRSEKGSWRVGAEPGSTGPSLLVSKAAPGTWTYTTNGLPTTGTRTGGSGGRPVSPAKAAAVAAPVFKGLGLSGAKVDASSAVGALRTVNADPRVGGLPTHGWNTTLEIGADGRTSSGFGRLSPLVKGDTYPVVSAATALKELNATRLMQPMGASGAAIPCTSTQSPPTSPTGGQRTAPSCAPGSGGEASPQTVEVRGASFGLASQYVSGVQTLVPAWLFDTATSGASGTSVVAQAAVDPQDVVRPSPTTAPPSVNPGGPIQPPRTTPASPPAAGTRGQTRITSYTASGRTLTVGFEGGLCDTYTASASESADQVRVSLIATPKPKGTMCPQIIRTMTRKVTLAAPLGGRAVVDAADGQRVSGG